MASLPIVRYKQKGFALPSILIASVVMLGVLFTALSAIAATRAALEDQYYNQIAREAAESGLAMAEACLKASAYVPQWTAAAPLRPNTNCSGVTQTGGGYSANISSSLTSRVTFRVEAATTATGGSVQLIAAVGTVELVRLSDYSGPAWKTYSTRTTGRMAAQTTFDTVAFGYYANQGAFYGLVYPDGKARAVGYNGFGNLGNGSTTNRTEPTVFNAPSAGAPIVKMYTQFLSLGTRMAAVDINGNAYISGMNRWTAGAMTTGGALGTGSTATQVTTPTRVALPAGVRVESANFLMRASYFIGSDNNVYSTGECFSGILGTLVASACPGGTTTPVRVALPTPNAADPNTIPVKASGWVQSDNLSSDGDSIFLRMEGGRVYAWGSNNDRQFGQGPTGSSVYGTPVKVGNFGDTGQTKAVQIATDGRSGYILDDAGDVYASGANFYGQIGGAAAPLLAYSGVVCLDNPGALSTGGRQLTRYACNDTMAQRVEFSADERLRIGTNVTMSGSPVTLCLEVSTSPSAGTAVIMAACDNSRNNQRWYMDDNGMIRNRWSQYLGINVCLNNPGNGTTNGVGITMETCSVTNAQRWFLKSSSYLTKVPIPGGKKVKRITTDHYSTLFLTVDGEVWGAGDNSRGQLGNGSSNRTNPKLVRFGSGVLPSDQQVVEVYTAGFASGDFKYSTFVILSDGSVWGSGSNSDGQLGDGTTTQRLSPVRMQLPIGVRARQVISGYGTTIVLATNGQIYSVGNNTNGQLGDGTTTNRSIPAANQFLNVFPTNYF